MALPKFYLEPRKTSNGKQPINMFFSIYGQRLQYYTGVRIDPKFYKESDSKGNPIDRSDINKLISEAAPYSTQIRANLKQIAIDVQNIANKAKANQVPVTKEMLKAELDKIHKHKEEPAETKETFTFMSFFEKVINDSKSGIRVMQKGKAAGQRYSHNAIKNYGTTLSAVKRFLLNRKIKTLQFDDINKAFYENFKLFCYNDEQKEVSTFAGYIKDIKSIMNEAKEHGLQSSDGHKAGTFVLPSYEADTIYLNDDQIAAIANIDLSDSDKFITHKVPARAPGRKDFIYDKKGERVLADEKIFYPVLDKVRDLFLIGAYTGLRFGNFTTLKAKDIQGAFIKVKQIKTGTPVTIPIMQKLKPVLEKYQGDLPSITNQKFNTYIKLVARLAGLTDLVETKSYKGNVQTVEQQPLYSLISSHTCRRSYATNMFRKGVPSMLIMSATGHATESSFLKYIRATNEDKAMLMAETLAKLGL
ncbi:tyrosine-type recombinase/integrase [Pedobacter zeae]|nr:tyrosine-type recombinase/integrase [Pedobacter zeae]MBB4108353.1 integrase [Pedobacter zeae]